MVSPRELLPPILNCDSVLNIPRETERRVEVPRGGDLKVRGDEGEEDVEREEGDESDAVVPIPRRDGKERDDGREEEREERSEEGSHRSTRPSDATKRNI